MKNRTLRKSFSNAWSGVSESVRTERNLRVHLLMVVLMGVLGVWLRIDTLRWGLLALASSVVVVTELLNTALERMVDMVKPEHCEEARQIKDMAAGAVLIAAVFAVLCGIAIFMEPLLLKLGLLM